MLKLFLLALKLSALFSDSLKKLIPPESCLTAVYSSESSFAPPTPLLFPSNVMYWLFTDRYSLSPGSITAHISLSKWIIMRD
ncbi:hypothetical protein ECANGB1_2637 [Enterospora canceri]|uniref:Secreted protein n=1 Tax=Enterospora canceri TaxID=1081671 RepID=A0A1Y1S911_9MICR|nr:hypothetical protein ECANGB1_2637 [Enterospora canceri]